MTSWLVTGASGFVGSRVCHALADRREPVRAQVRSGRAPQRAGVEVVRADLTRSDALPALVRGAGVIVHCAAALDPIEDEALGMRINRDATLALARAAAAGGCRAFVFVSSQAAIGWQQGGGLLGPDAACAPTTIYGRSKRAAELALLDPRPDARLGAMRVAVVRPPTVYGPGERRNFLALARAVASGLFVVPGRGDNRMSFCHLDNLAEALVAIGLEPRAQGVLHVADASPVSLRRLARTLAAAIGARVLPLPFPMPIAKTVARALELAFAPLGRTPPLSRARLQTLTRDAALDTRATVELGIAPQVGFEEGVAETVADYKAHGLLR